MTGLRGALRLSADHGELGAALSGVVHAVSDQQAAADQPEQQPSPEFAVVAAHGVKIGEI